MIKKVKNFIPLDKNINVIDATFGGGGYSKFILESFKVDSLIAIDRDPITKFFSKKIENKFKEKFILLNGNFSQIDKLIEKTNFKKNKKKKFDIIIFDLGLSSNQLDDYKRGFSFDKNGPLKMNMGKTKLLASDILNNFDEKKLADIFFKLGNEKFAKKIARNIIEFRKINFIKNTNDLVNIIKKSVKINKNKKIKINPATKTFQALRIYVNDELNELKMALKQSERLLSPKGKILVVSFQSLEDKIVKDFFNHKSGKKWRSSRHYPEIADKGPITLKIITKKPIRPDEREIFLNPRSRSAKLRVAEKLSECFK